jgi:hypothetical protein
MHVRYLLGAALITASASLSLNGCSGASTPTAPAMTASAAVASQAHHRGRSTAILLLPGRTGHRVTTRSWLNHVPPSNPLLYISDYSTDVVNIYTQAGSGQTPIGQITGLNEPQGLWVDINQNLWVANTAAFTLQAYHRGATTPFRTLTDPNGYPAGVCGNNNRALVYGTDITTLEYGAGQTINVYARGATSPTSVLTDSNASSLYECAVDSKGNLFVSLSSINYPYGGEIDEFLKGSTTPIALITNLIYPIGITLDKYDALSVADAFYGSSPYYYSELYIYDKPYTYGPALSTAGTGLIVETALRKNQTQIWGADATNLVGQQWSYPNFRLGNATSNEGLEYPDGLALSPATPQ